MNEKWFALDITQIEKKLKTNAATGLSRKAARSRRITSEEDTFFSVPKKKYSRMLLELLGDFSLVILLVATIFSLFFESEAQIGSIIFVFLFLNFLVSFAVYAYAQYTEEKHRESFQPTTKVIRDSKLYHVGYDQVVPGDVILIEAGNVLEADVRLITSEHLKVYMRTDQDHYQLLSKYAEGLVNPSENDACNMANMLHAGSIVEEGNARGIVVAVGKYTYLGAMLQGVQRKNSAVEPFSLRSWKKVFSTLGMISLVSILPLSILGLIGNKVANGTGLLSITFLALLSLAASFFVAKIITCCKFFFTYPIRFFENKSGAIAVRSAEAFERLSGIDYLFVLDGSSLTDGVLHCEKVYLSNGEVLTSRLNPDGKYLSELVALYSEWEKKNLATSTSTRNIFSHALCHYMEQTKVDVIALHIRCTVQSFLHGNLMTEPDRLYFSERGQKKILSVFSGETGLDLCDFYYRNGLPQPMTPEHKTSLKQLWSENLSKGKQILGFAISNSENGFSSTQCAFVGCLILTEGIDKNAAQQIRLLEQKGIHVIAFPSPITSILRPEIPSIQRNKREVTSTEFEQKNLPITHGFGKFDSYVGMSEEQILTLLRYAHQQRKKVAVVSFTEFAPDVVQEADVFISCASIAEDSELRKNEIPGFPTSTSCTQTVKIQADILIERPTWKKQTGGLREIAHAIEKGTAACRNLNRFFHYLITAQLCRILTTVIPILFGHPELDARHILFFGCIIDWGAFFIFSTHTPPAGRGDRNALMRTNWNNLFSQCAFFLIATTTASIFSMIIPRIIGAFTDGYLYRIEFSFLTVLLLHSVLIYHLLFGSWKEIRTISKRIFSWLTLLSGSCLFFIFCLLFSPLGSMMEFLKLPILYVLAAFLPPLLLSGILEISPWIQTKIDQRRKKSK